MGAIITGCAIKVTTRFTGARPVEPSGRPAWSRVEKFRAHFYNYNWPFGHKAHKALRLQCVTLKLTQLLTSLVYIRIPQD